MNNDPGSSVGVLYKKFWKDRDGVTPLISTMLLIVIMIGIVSSILYWSIPAINRIGWDTEFRTSLGHFQALDGAIEDTVREGTEGSTRTVSLSIPGGDLRYKKSYSRWFISYANSTDTEITFSGLEDEQDDPTVAVDFTIDISPITSFDLWIWRYTSFDEARGQDFLSRNSGDVINSGRSLFNTTRGEVYKTVFCLYYPGTDQAIGWAVLYHMNALVNEIPSQFGTAKIISENGAIVTTYPDTPYVRNDPMLTPHGQSLQMTIVQLKAIGIGAATAGNYKVTTRINQFTYNYTSGLGNLKLYIWGDYTEAWYLHFSEDFREWRTGTDKDDIEYRGGFMPLEIYEGGNTMTFDQGLIYMSNALTLKVVHAELNMDIDQR